MEVKVRLQQKLGQDPCSWANFQYLRAFTMTSKSVGNFLSDVQIGEEMLTKMFFGSDQNGLFYNLQKRAKGNKLSFVTRGVIRLKPWGVTILVFFQIQEILT